MLTLADVDEALSHARAVPVADRNAGWHAFVDSLLEQRSQLVGPTSQPHETRVLFSAETR